MFTNRNIGDLRLMSILLRRSCLVKLAILDIGMLAVWVEFDWILEKMGF